MTRGFWLALGFLALALGAAGVVLPLLPTVPFLLLAAFSFARSSDRLHQWLLNHRVFGPLIQRWEERGAIGRRAKLMATVSMAAAFGFSLWLQLAAWILVVQALTLCGVALFIWTRPEG